MSDIIFIGLSLSSILLLIALGLSITYGAMGVINMAHGELVMIGAYTAVLAGLHLNLNLFFALPLAFVTSGLAGLVIERLVIRRLYGRIIDTLLATWGVAILLQQLVRLEFGLSFLGIHVEGLGPGLQNMTVPGFLTQPFDIAGITIQPYRSFIIVVTLALTALTWWLMYRTPTGVQVRAIMRNPQIAAACGIDVRRVSALTFAYGSGLAGVAGVLLAGFKTVMPEMGAAVVIDGFLVVVVGGVGSLLGTLLSAAVLGQINGVFAILTNDILARAVVFGVVIALILWRPRGLFSFKSR
ncbi:urea ABC transporter permease subunit UrtB [Pseudodonghicola flavimaris]|uniref:Urea ABC transporter permease subunit UrtB n=1 Tax=Pseudodonghicola flavimaris TaxID=3050036 RepID=A0ABT7F0D6_9RHOB|nr:urea ABC transporter permease subunit UrtB [Pseudodonghicola flavimaris]MDK3018053.1 urea ABC transporter permease subunit UrtB [Pseudodonghicola flavimaris]